MSNKPPTRSELKHQAILDAAKQAFLEHGVQNTSMDELAALAQVSKRTVYNHFSSKEALIMELIGSLWRQAADIPSANYDPEGDLHPQLCRLIEAEITVISGQEYLALNRVAFDYFFHRPDALRGEVEKFSRSETGVKRWIRAAHKDGRLRKLDEEIASGQIHSLIKGSCFWPQMAQVAPLLNKDERHALADRTAAMFLSHYQV
ncbi:TetR/AcrR family transcriptional regulator [Microbulbifer sp. MCCC 1A16149]|uniref:TetR/AcrR family transcriptional regulator n=1 Tax=Microbulbifer sp. MCCC 1A16149 TaxID=3411322 RepID=UPI003D1475AC